jgi:hypothetical protein
MPEVKDKRIRSKWEKILFDCQIEPQFSHFDVSSSHEDDPGHGLANERQRCVVKKKGNSVKTVSQPSLQEDRRRQEPIDDYWY